MALGVSAGVDLMRIGLGGDLDMLFGISLVKSQSLKVESHKNAFLCVPKWFIVITYTETKS